jgi:hypothetical protein
MTLPEHCVTRFPRTSILAALALVLGGAVGARALAQSQSAPALTGKWQLSCTGPRGETRQIPLEIQQRGATLSGSYNGARRSGQLHGSLKGNQVSLELAGKRRSASFTGTVDGNTLRVHTARGISCTGTRQ